MTHPLLDIVMPFISMLGNFGAIWIAAAILFMLSKKYRTTGITVAIALILCALIGNCLIKPLAARPRPFDVIADVVLLIPPPKDFSFPSGHTLSAFAAATVIFLNDRRWGSAALVLAFLIAFSRLYLYVHYPSDVFAGMVMGVGIAFLSVYIKKSSMTLLNKKKGQQKSK